MSMHKQYKSHSPPKPQQQYIYFNKWKDTKATEVQDVHLANCNELLTPYMYYEYSSTEL